MSKFFRPANRTADQRLAVWLAMLASLGLPTSPARADSEPWDLRIVTDKGCVLYEHGYSNKDLPGQYWSWTGACQAGQLVNGQGSVIYKQRECDCIEVETGRMVNGYWDGLVSKATYAVDANGRWDDRVALPPPVTALPNPRRYNQGCPQDEYNCTPGKAFEPEDTQSVSMALVNVNAARPGTVSPSTRIARLAPVQPTANVPTGDPVRGQATFDDGMAAFNAGNYSLAIQRYTEAMALDPANAAKWQITRGIVYGLSGQPDAALRDYTASIAAAPNVATGYYYRSGAYIASGQTALAYADVQMALRLAPDDDGVKRRAQQLGVPLTSNAKPPAGTGSYSDGGGYSTGGASVSGPNQTGVNTVKSPKIYDTPQEFAKAIERGEAKLPPGMVIRNGVVVSAASPAARSPRTVPNANACITVTDSTKVYNGVQTKVHLYRNACPYQVLLFAKHGSQTTYHIFFPLEPGQSGDDPYATMDGTSYTPIRSYVACRNDNGYSNNEGPTPGGIVCVGP